MSVPAERLMTAHLIKGKVLDFGCGKGRDVADLKTQGIDVVGYDPNFNNKPELLKERYDTIICNYVLNVLPLEDEAVVIEQIKSALKDDGIAYVTVRRDLTEDSVKRTGALQRRVILNLPVVRHTSSYKIFKLTKEDTEYSVLL